MKYSQSRPGFELVSPCPFPITITITPLFICIYVYVLFVGMSLTIIVSNNIRYNDLYLHSFHISLICFNISVIRRSVVHNHFKHKSNRYIWLRDTTLTGCSTLRLQPHDLVTNCHWANDHLKTVMHRDMKIRSIFFFRSSSNCWKETFHHFSYYNKICILRHPQESKKKRRILNASAGNLHNVFVEFRQV